MSSNNKDNQVDLALETYRLALKNTKTLELARQVAVHSIPKTIANIAVTAAIGAAAGVAVATTTISSAIPVSIAAAGAIVYNNYKTDEAEALKELTYKRPRSMVVSKLSLLFKKGKSTNNNK
jgi:hypothetical protein